MKVGYLLDTHAVPYGSPIPSRDDVQRSLDFFFAEAAICEATGFDSINVPDRHMRAETHFPNPLQLLTALAVRTERCKLITHSLVQTLYHPMHVAEQAAMIDQLSKGRLILTTAMGYHDDYWRMFGMTRAHRRDRFVEGLEIIRRAFESTEPFSYDGVHYQLEDVWLTPPPYRPGGPEIWIGGQADPSIERAGAYADGWCVDLYPVDPDTWRRRADLYRESAAKAGRATKIVVLREAWIAETRAELLRFCEFVAAEQRYSYAHSMPLHAHKDFLDPDTITAERWAEHAVVGTPEECAEKMIRLRDEMGFDEICLRLRRPMGPSLEESLDVLRRFGEEVIPLVDAA